MKSSSVRVLVGLCFLFALFVIAQGKAEVSGGLNFFHISVGLFSEGDRADWEERSFVGHTQYSIVDSSQGLVMKAEANASASGLFREMEIDLSQTPCLHWSWRVEGVLSGIDETTKAGDDYPARVYVIVSEGILPWQMRAINYVWFAHRPVGDAAVNPYTDRTIMQSGMEAVGQWRTETRNIQADFQTFFGRDIETLDAIAIMTDTDTSGRTAKAYYGDISVSNRCVD